MIAALLFALAESTVDAVGDVSPVDVAVGAALTAIAAFVAVALARRAARAAGWLVRWFARVAADELNGRLDDRLDERLEAKLAPLRDDLSYVRAQLDYNGGSTVRDQVHRVTDDVARIRRSLADGIAALKTAGVVRRATDPNPELELDDQEGHRC